MNVSQAFKTNLKKGKFWKSYNQLNFYTSIQQNDLSLWQSCKPQRTGTRLKFFNIFHLHLFLLNFSIISLYGSLRDNVTARVDRRSDQA